MASVLSVQSASVRARLHGVSLELGAGEVLAVVGPNGAGKSTLVAACLGLLSLDGGEVSIAGQPVARLRPRDRAECMGWLPQRDPGGGGLSAVEVVAAARYRFGESHALALRRSGKILAERGLESFADRPMASLSGGERQRVRVAALVAQESRLWLLDEPGNHLDPASQLSLWGELGAAVARGLGVLVVTHDVTLLAHLRGVPTRILALEDGRARWTIGSDDPDLAERLGEVLDLKLAWVEVDGVRRLVVVGRR